MMADVEWKMEGLDSLLKKLESVSYDVKRKGGRSALRKAAKMIADDAKNRAQAMDDPETGRSIADNIDLRWSSRTFKRTGNLAFRVGVKGNAKVGKGTLDKSTGARTPHWRLLEFGTENMAARPFMRPALAENTGRATDIFVTEYEKAIDRAIKRAAKGK